MYKKRVLSALAALAVAAMMLPASPGVAANSKKSQPRGGTDVIKGVDESKLFGGKASFEQMTRKLAREMARKNAAAKRKRSGYRVGDKRWWPAWDDTLDFPVYLKKYKLRGVSKHMEVWTAAGKAGVSKGLWYPEGDCRNDYPDRIKVTKKKVKYLIRQFENNMWPVETTLFSKPPKRGGKHAQPKLLVDNPKKDYGIKGGYWRGKGARVVTLVDNVRDDQFYDTDDANDLSRIGGFFSGYLNEATDRNIMTMDSWNWKHSTGANPPSNPVPGNVCESVTADPFGIENTFAHEFQHLLEYYADFDGETSWIDEGMADFAAYATGYSEPDAQMNEMRWDGHIQCFLGNIQTQTEFNPNPQDNCGPENSLTWWGDQDEDDEFEILADYGIAYMMMLMLHDEYGDDAITFLHNDLEDGLQSLQNLLDLKGDSRSALEKIHQLLVMVALDGYIDSGISTVNGNGSVADYQVDSLETFLDWTVEDAYDWPGAPPNGADFVRARHANGDPLGAADIDSISFDGAQEFSSEPTEWTEVTPEGYDGGSTLAAIEKGPEFDSAIVREVNVPADNATLTFDTKYNTEFQWDWFFVQVSTDNGETWESLSNANTRSDYAEGSYPTVPDNVPGFTGESGVAEEDQITNGGLGPDAAQWVNESFDLTAYAGQDVHLAFRYITDWAFEDHGVYVDNVVVGGTTISEGDDLNQWMSPTELNPPDVEGFTVQLVAYDDAHTTAWVGELPLDANHEGELSGEALDAVIGTTAETVLILVTFDDSTEAVFQYAPYELRVDNHVQDGGS